MINNFRFWFSVIKRQLAFELFGADAQEFYFKWWEGHPAVEQCVHLTALRRGLIVSWFIIIVLLVVIAFLIGGR